jgi:hypothetical protein
VHKCKSPVYRTSRAAKAVRGKAACQKATDTFSVVTLRHLSYSARRAISPKKATDSSLRGASSSATLRSMQLRLPGIPELHVELYVEHFHSRTRMVFGPGCLGKTT